MPNTIHCRIRIAPSLVIGSTGLHCPRPQPHQVLPLPDTQHKAERTCQKLKHPKGFTGRFQGFTIQFQKCRKSSCNLVFLSASFLPSLSVTENLSGIHHCAGCRRFKQEFQPSEIFSFYSGSNQLVLGKVWTSSVFLWGKFLRKILKKMLE